MKAEARSFPRNQLEEESEAPKKSQGFTPVPDEVLDSLYRFSGNEVKVLCFIARATNGFSGYHGWFPLRWLAKRTGIPKSTVARVVRALIARNWIRVLETGRSGVRKLRLIQDEELLRRLRGKKGVPSGRTASSRYDETAVSHNRGTIDKTNSNKTSSKTKTASRNQSDIEIEIREKYPDAPWNDSEFCKKIRRYGWKGSIAACERVLDEFGIPLLEGVP